MHQVSHLSSWSSFRGQLQRSYFHELPVELEEQAMVDGCSRLGALARITIPLAAPGIVAVMSTICIGVWNDVTFTLFLTKSTEVQPVSVVLHREFHTFRALRDWGLMLAEGVVH